MASKLMNEFPFSRGDWDRVSEAGRAIVNASSVDDVVLGDSSLEELRNVLAELTDKYGHHPIIFETEADFTAEACERIRLYKQAKQLAEANHLTTYSIRLSMARVLIEELDDVDSALTELEACRTETTTDGDDDDRKKWDELHAACLRRTNG